MEAMEELKKEVSELRNKIERFTTILRHDAEKVKELSEKVIKSRKSEDGVIKDYFDSECYFYAESVLKAVYDLQFTDRKYHGPFTDSDKIDEINLGLTHSQKNRLLGRLGMNATIEDLCKLSPDEFLEIKGLGSVAFRKVSAFLEKNGLDFDFSRYMTREKN